MDGIALHDRRRFRHRVRARGARRRGRRPRARHRGPPLPQRGHRRAACPRPTTTSSSARTGPSRTRATISRPSGPRSGGSSSTPASTPARSSGSASTSRPARCSRPRPTARRCAASTPTGATPTPGSSSGSTTPPSPRPTTSTDVAGELERAVARPLRRQDLVGVVLPEGPPDPARGARRLSRRRPAHRGRRLGRLAAHRGRDAEQLHGRLQGASGRPPTASRIGAFFEALEPGFGSVVDDKMSRDIVPIGGAGRRPDRARRRPGLGFGRARPWPSPTSTPTSRSRPRP